MTHFKKMTAAVMAVATLATGMIPLSANALYYDENSKFTYDLKVESASDDMIKVTFYTTYNPGVADFSLALTYDREKLEFFDDEIDRNFYRETTSAVAAPTTRDIVITLAATNFAEDYFEPISISYYFKMKDAGGVYDFSACVYQYESLSEGISFGDNIHSVPVIPDEVTAAIVKGVYTRKIGDVIPDESINMSDVTESLGIVSFLNSCTTANVAKTAVLNTLLNADASYTLQSGTTGKYRERLKNSLYANNVPFAEVADCDKNGMIEKKDSELLIEYYAQIAASQNPQTLINTEISKVVYADIIL